MENAPVQIDIKSLLFDVKKELLLSDNSNDIFLLGLLDRGARRLNTTESLIITDCGITVEDNRFMMPSDAKQVIAFKGENCGLSGFFVDIPFFNRCDGCNPTGCNPLVSILVQRGRWFYFQTNINSGTEIQIAYTKVNRGCDGMMIADEESGEALINYACWKFANAFRRTREYMPDQIQTWKQDYMDQAAKSRGNAARRTLLNQRSQIHSRMNAILFWDVSFSWAGTFNCGVTAQNNGA